MDIDYPFVKGRVLKVLVDQYPEFLARSLLIRALDLEGIRLGDHEFNGVVTYLRDKGYVEFRTKPIPGGKDKLYSFRLTPAGVDLVEGIESDEAIEL